MSERYEELHISESDQEASKPSPLDLQPQQPELLRFETEPTNGVTSVGGASGAASSDGEGLPPAAIAQNAHPRRASPVQQGPARCRLRRPCRRERKAV